MSRTELKNKAKGMITSLYWPIIGATALVMYVTGAVSAIPWFGTVAFFFLSPVSLGLTIYYVDIADGKQTSIGQIFTDAFDGRYYLRRVGGYALMTLFTFLWSLLFLIPGIVKAYSYALTPYILAKYPGIPAKEALKLSMKIMDGRKWELFVLHLSFIGWGILSALTFGILAIFFVSPYFMITTALWMKNTMEQETASGAFVYNMFEEN